MGLFLQNGTRVTKASVATTNDPDPLVRLNNDLFQTRSYGRNDKKPEGSVYTLFRKAGTVMRRSELDALFPSASVAGIAPATGPAAGGTVVTITGAELDGVTSVTFDGTPGTALTVVSAREIRVTTPAGVAGPADIAVVDDGGTVIDTSAYTYA